MLNKTKKILKDIKDLRIQGASNIAFACQDAFLFEVENYKGKDILTYFTNLGRAFWKSRDTEPAMKHFIAKFLVFLEKNLHEKKRKEKLVNWICEFKTHHVNAIYSLVKSVNKLPIRKKVEKIKEEIKDKDSKLSQFMIIKLQLSENISVMN